MLRPHIQSWRGEFAKTGLLILLALGLALVARDWILEGDLADLSLRVLGLVAAAIGLFILANWRSGLILFVVWVVFEDLPRKYLGNNMAIYFGKDVLVAIVYAAFVVALMKRTTRTFRPPFLIPLLVFFGVGLVQVFNPNSPSIFYGLLGMKLYFFYVPLMFVGYSVITTELDLRRVMLFLLLLATVVAGLGVVQGVVGLDFLNPDTLAPELETLGRLTRMTPLSRQAVDRPTSVFVSDGRFAAYVLVAFIFSLGVAGYMLVRQQRHRFAYAAAGLLLVAAVMSASRGAVMWCVLSTLVIAAGLLWGAPTPWQHRARLVRGLRRTLLALAASLVLAAILLPQAIGVRWAFLWETLSPSSPASELVHRVRDYPFSNFMQAFDFSDWALGYGTGTASLGVQYVSRFLGVPPPNVGVESGHGTVLLEMGVAGLVCWLWWTLAATIAAWRAVRRLKGTHLFPLGFTIFWFVFLLLFPFTYGGMAPYQNFVLNAHLWLLLGVLFRLPELAEGQLPSAAVAPAARRARGAVPFPGLRAGGASSGIRRERVSK